MNRAAWDPWGEMRRLQRDFESLLDRSVGRRSAPPDEYPPVNVSRHEEGLLVEALCPGVDRGTFDVSLVGDSLTVRGERKAEAVVDSRYRRRERQVGPFTRTIRLADRFDPDRVEATYRDGILRIRLLRAPQAAPRKITVES